MHIRVDGSETAQYKITRSTPEQKDGYEIMLWWSAFHVAMTSLLAPYYSYTAPLALSIVFS